MGQEHGWGAIRENAIRCFGGIGVAGDRKEWLIGAVRFAAVSRYRRCIVIGTFCGITLRVLA